MLLGRTSVLAKNVSNSLVRGYHGGQPGANLPFSIANRYKLTALFIVFLGSGLGAPFFVLRHSLLKKKQ